MARIRTIKPTFFVNEEVAALPYEWRLLFIGLWTQADREGRLEDRPQRLKAALFAYDDLQIKEGLGCLANAGLIFRYEANGQRLISIPRWAKHQKPHKHEPVSELPPPDHKDGHSPPLMDPGELILENGVRDRSRDQFGEFWAAYPRKVAKDAARLEWHKLHPDSVTVDRILQALEVQKRSLQWTRDNGQFVPHARTWLHQKRWKDDAEEAAVSKQEGDWWGHFPHCASNAECVARKIRENREEAKKKAAAS